MLFKRVITLEPGASIVGDYVFNDDGSISRSSGTLASTGVSPQCLTIDLAYNVYIGNAAGEVRTYVRDGSTKQLQFIKSISGAGTNITSVSVTDGFDKISLTPLQITSTSLADGVVGTGYEQALTTSGGLDGYAATWKLVSGTLPAGLVLSEDSTSRWSLIGNPTAPGSSTFTLEASEGDVKVTKSYTLNVTTTAPTLTGQFLNIDQNASDTSLTFTLGTKLFPATSVGQISAAIPVTAGTSAWSDKNTGGTTVQSGNFALNASLAKYVFFQAGDRAGIIGFPTTFPSAGQSAIMALPAMPDLGSIDVFVLAGTSNTIVTSALAINNVTQLEVAPGTYRVRFNEVGTTNVYATTPVFTIAANGRLVASTTATAAGTGRVAYANGL